MVERWTDHLNFQGNITERVQLLYHQLSTVASQAEP